MRRHRKLMGELFPAKIALELGVFAALVSLVAAKTSVVFVAPRTQFAPEAGSPHTYKTSTRDSKNWRPTFRYSVNVSRIRTASSHFIQSASNL